jgi:hypothetical protein
LVKRSEIRGRRAVVTLASLFGMGRLLEGSCKLPTEEQAFAKYKLNSNRLILGVMDQTQG